MSPPRLEGVQYATGEEWRALCQSGNNAQLCMCPVVKVKSDAVKNNTA